MVWSSYYTVDESLSAFYEDYLRAHCRDSQVLEYGCGIDNVVSLLVANGAASVKAIDISPVAVQQGRERLTSDEAKLVEFQVMDAENLEFEDQSFDLICGTSILHHLDLDRAYGELARVLRHHGSAMFVEPLGHNPLINLYRRRTPDLRTPDEHPLLFDDISEAERHFESIEPHFFYLTSLAAVPFRNLSFFRSIIGGLDRFDQFIFRHLPPARRHAWQVAIKLRGPMTESLRG